MEHGATLRNLLQAQEQRKIPSMKYPDSSRILPDAIDKRATPRFRIDIMLSNK